MTWAGAFFGSVVVLCVTLLIMLVIGTIGQRLDRKKTDRAPYGPEDLN